MKAMKIIPLGLVICSIISVVSCSKNKGSQIADPAALVIKVESTNFLTAGLSEPITIVPRTLSN